MTDVWRGADPPRHTLAPQRLPRFDDDFLELRLPLFLLLFFLPLFLRDGTLPPSWRASESPMAIACLRLVTFFFERAERSVPSFISSMLRWTLLEAFFP